MFGPVVPQGLRQKIVKKKIHGENSWSNNNGLSSANVKEKERDEGAIIEEIEQQDIVYSYSLAGSSGICQQLFDLRGQTSGVRKRFRMKYQFEAGISIKVETCAFVCKFTLSLSLFRLFPQHDKKILKPKYLIFFF